MPRSKSIRRVSVLLTLGVFLTPATVFASTGGKSTSVAANITHGELSITAPSVSTPFQGVILNGSVKTVSAGLSNWSVTDATGTGDGWDVQLQATQLSEVPPSTGFASGTTALTLPQGSLSLQGTRSITAQKGSYPVSTTGGPLLENISSIIDSSSPVEIIKTNSNYGLGTYTVNEPTNGLLLTLEPKTTKVDTINYPNQPTPYETTLTYTVVSGPSTTSTSSSSSTTPTYVSVDDSNAMGMTGSNYVDLGNKSQYNFGSNADFTIEFWAKVGSFGGNGFISHRPANGGSGSGLNWWRIYNNSGGLELEVAQNFPNTWIESNQIGSQNTWAYYTFEIKKESDGYFHALAYLNGSLVGDVNSNKTTLDTDVSTNLLVGKWYTYYSSNTSLRDLSIWSNARSTTQIQQDMQNKITASESDLNGFWPFDEGTGSTIHDLSQYGNDGTFYSPSWVSGN